ncbi:hypothetical protein F5Y02DRAFT_415857 [Annulohypoxylon stygium]|nr:hypothetical protein F5Y02DRAFT_415857 [Annulohypoxylon stygium]
MPSNSTDSVEFGSPEARTIWFAVIFSLAGSALVIASVFYIYLKIQRRRQQKKAKENDLEMQSIPEAQEQPPEQPILNSLAPNLGTENSNIPVEPTPGIARIEKDTTHKPHSSRKVRFVNPSELEDVDLSK